MSNVLALLEHWRRKADELEGTMDKEIAERAAEIRELWKRPGYVEEHHHCFENTARQYREFEKHKPIKAVARQKFHNENDDFGDSDLVDCPYWAFEIQNPIDC